MNAFELGQLVKEAFADSGEMPTLTAALGALVGAAGGAAGGAIMSPKGKRLRNALLAALAGGVGGGVIGGGSGALGVLGALSEVGHLDSRNGLRVIPSGMRLSNQNIVGSSYFSQGYESDPSVSQDGPR